jgi:TPR repeat protein
MNSEGNALADGIYWMAEKLAWAHDDVRPDPREAMQLYRQSAELGFSDAHIRIGELQEHGKGTERSPQQALASYREALRLGNPLGYAFLGRLLSRSEHVEWRSACGHSSSVLLIGTHRRNS